MSDEQSKLKQANSWITSIAISVLCCSVLFVLFASYLVDLKADIRDDMMHINAVEKQQSQILANIDALAKRLPAAPASSIAITAPTTDATAPANTATPQAETPATPPAAAAPTTTTPTAPATTSGTETAPSTVTVPVIPAAKP